MSALKRRLKTLGKHGLRKLFETGQRLGIDVLPRHFYSEIPDIRDLREEGSWRSPGSMAGISGIDPRAQLDFVAECCTAEVVERLAKGDIYPSGCAENGEPGYGPTEADFLYAFVRSRRPPRVVQVGCGVATAIILRAAGEAGYRPEVVCIEPYPTEFLKRADRAGALELIPEKAQNVPLEILTELGEHGMLFVDSTHAVRPGSDVNRLILEVLPRLKRGDWVHFHDIYFPYDYQRRLLDDELFFCNESVLLQAFLTDNPRYRIRASLSMLHYACPDELRRFLPHYQPARDEDGLEASGGHFPASTYLQVVG